MPVAERHRIYKLANQGVPYREIYRVTRRPEGTIKMVISDGILEGRVRRRYTKFDKLRTV